jgi:hypothetical protein
MGSGSGGGGGKKRMSANEAVARERAAEISACKEVALARHTAAESLARSSPRISHMLVLPVASAADSAAATASPERATADALAETNVREVERQQPTPITWHRKKTSMSLIAQRHADKPRPRCAHCSLPAPDDPSGDALLANETAAIRRQVLEACESGDVNWLREIARDSRVSGSDARMVCAVGAACSGGHHRIVAELGKHPFHLGKEDARRCSAIHLAARRGECAVLDALAEIPYSLRRDDALAQGALECACAWGNSQFVEALSREPYALASDPRDPALLSALAAAASKARMYAHLHVLDALARPPYNYRATSDQSPLQVSPRSFSALSAAAYYAYYKREESSSSSLFNLSLAAAEPLGGSLANQRSPPLYPSSSTTTTTTAPSPPASSSVDRRALGRISAV